MTLLPEPDSPTTPNTSPWATSKLTPRTTSRGPRGVEKRVSQIS